jgi:hypothetical protein
VVVVPMSVVVLGRLRLVRRRVTRPSHRHVGHEGRVHRAVVVAVGAVAGASVRVPTALAVHLAPLPKACADDDEDGDADPQDHERGAERVYAPVVVWGRPLGLCGVEGGHVGQCRQSSLM